MEKKKPVDKTIYKGPKKAANKVPKETKLVAKKDIATKPLEKVVEVKPVHEPIKIKMNSTLTENSTILDEQLIEWEGDNLNKILSRCVKLACSIAPNKLYDYQVKPMRRIFKSVLTNDGANLTMLCARQMGKCFGKGTKVMMFDGSIKNVEDVIDGDVLMGDDSTPRIVKGTTKGNEDLFRINPRSPRATPYVVNKSHILSLKVRNRFSPATYEDIPLEAVLNKHMSLVKQSHIQGYQVPVEFKENNVNLQLDPYWLGLWLGDGISASTGICTMDTEIKEYIESYAESKGMRVSQYHGKKESRASNYYIVGKDSEGATNPILASLRYYNVFKNKHIPMVYKTSSRETRLKLLAGIMDTDGHSSKSEKGRSTMELILKDTALFYDTVFLCRSLGFRVATSDKIVNGVTYKRMNVYGDLSVIPVKLERKKRESHVLREDPLAYGFTIEPIGKGDYYGFAVDGNHRFLLEDFTVTHNTETSAVTIATLMIIAPLLSQMFPLKFPYFKHGIMIGMFAPTAEQCATTHARVELILSHDSANALLIDPDIRAKKKYDSGIIEIKGGLKKVNGREEASWTSFVRFQTAAKQAKIESKSYHVIFGDELQEIDDTKLTKSILPMLAAYNGTSVYTGTPSTQICEFYNAILRNRTVDIKKTDPNDHNHFEYDYKIGQLYNPRYKQFIKNTIERMGENSDSFKMSYSLQWLIEKGMALTSQDYSNYLAKSDLEIEMFPSGGSQYVAGLDLGKGKDCSVLTIFRVQKTGDGKIVKTVARWEELSNVSWRAQYNEVLQWVNTYGIIALAVDATGKGDPICEELIEYLADTECVVYPVNFNPKSKNELAVGFYEDMYQGNIIVPSGARTRAIKQYTTFYSQFLSAVKTYNKGLVQIEHPPEVAGASDDYVDSFLLGLFAAKKAIVYEVRQEMNPLYGPKSKNGEDIYRKVYETHRIRINDLFAR